MFWRFGGYANVSSIDSILDKPDCTLEEVLDENDVEQELKSQNAKLIDFLRDEVALGKLLRYVVAPKPTISSSGGSSPESEKGKGIGLFGKSRSKVRSKSRGAHDDEQDTREDKWRRYSYVSTQLLSSDVWSICESLMDNTDLLGEFWNFIKHDAPLDNTQASYFSKVNESLLEKKPVEMVTFFKSLDKVVENMMKHVDCPVIMDLLLKIISLEKDSVPGIVDWLQSEGLIPKLLAYITSDHPATVQTAAGDFLKAIITISANATGQDTSVIGPNELTRQLVSQKCIDNLLAEMLKGGNPLTVGVGIIIEVIRKNNSDYDQDTQIGPDPKSSDPIYLGSLLRTFANHVPDFMELILSKNHTVVTEKGNDNVPRKDLSTSWGSKIEPLGFDRFKTCELMAELLHCSNMALLNKKGSEIEVRQRDAERERLKAEGNLASDRPNMEEEEVDFGASVDSSGFHHAEATSPLGDSPEVIRGNEPSTTGLEEDFEKVNLSEADDPAEGRVSSLGEDGSGDEALSSRDTTIKPTNKRRSSLLTQQLQREKDQAQSPISSPEIVPESDADKPAPLFSRRDPDFTLPPAQASESSENTSEEDFGTQPQPSELGTTDVESDVDPAPGPGIQREDDGSPVIGDLLKVMFVEHHVVPTIIGFFFRFPWNNFLHNVVYDVVQQVFNGATDRGYNRQLAIDLFETGAITDRIIEGHKRSNKSQQEHKMRLGYMGHLTLIAEEVVKFTERQPTEQLAQSVVDKITSDAWTDFVEHALAETRERDNAVLGGIRPDASLGPRQAVLNAVNAAQGGFSTGSNALANAGLAGNGLDSLDLTSAGAAGYGLKSNSSNALLSGFGSSDDEEDDDNEESELAEQMDESQSRRRDDDDDQSDTTIPPQPSGEPPPIPAPLAIPPSRARRQLAARLAEKQKRSTNAGTSPGEDESQPGFSYDRSDPLASTNDAFTKHNDDFPVSDSDFPDIEPLDSVGGPTTGFADDFTSGSNHSDAALSDEDVQKTATDDSDEDARPGQPQTTREAMQRRPLDEDDEDESAEGDTSSDSDTAPVAAARREARPAGPTRSQSHTHELSVEAKRKEQEKLLRRWGFEEADDSDEEDEPVSMGSKYLARRRTGSR